MSLHLITGPAGSGKTRKLMQLAHKITEKRGQVYWIGLPHQRARTLTRLAAATGTLLGIQFFTLQQLYYRLLENHPGVKPLAGPGLQLAHVAQAIHAARGRTPTPGEASLYHRAIKEAKRAGLTAGQLPQGTQAERDLAEIYASYVRVNGKTWDYEDYRAHALEQLDRPKVSLPRIVIDGFIELHPTDVQVIQALARHTGVYLALQTAPETLEVDDLERLSAPLENTTHAYALANPVQETRWVLRSLKRDLANGTPMHELLVITPERHKGAFLALAPEYGVPLTPATPVTLGETPAGRLLKRLLTFANAPDRHTLHAIHALQPIAAELTRRNVHGREATNAIAAELGLTETLDAWAARLTPPTDASDLPTWARGMLELLTELDPSIKANADAWERTRESLLLRGSEASVITAGPAVAVWWAHLLDLYPDPSDRPRGIPLATPLEATGLTTAKAYITRGNAGEHTADQGEDYFVPEDVRADPGELAAGRLPKRITGRTRSLLAHLKHRGHDVVITYPLADQDGPLAPEKALAGESVTPAPALPAASVRETRGGNTAYQPTYAPIQDERGVRVSALETFLQCPFRARFENLVDDDQPAPWRQVLYDLLAQPKLDDERIDQIAKRHPNYAPWLERHRTRLKRLTLQHRLDLGDNVYARVHGIFTDANDEKRLHLVWFGNPETTDQEALEKRTKESWERKSAIHQALDTYPVTRVAVSVWPIGFDPVLTLEATHDREQANALGITHTGKLTKPNVAATLKRYAEGDTTPKGGWHCRECRLRDVSRVA